jgi:hypothetical protein
MHHAGFLPLVLIAIAFLAILMILDRRDSGGSK